MSAKNQFTIPQSVLKKAKIKAGDKVEYVVSNTGIITVIPKRDTLEDLAGAYPKPKNPIPINKMSPWDNS